MFDLKIDPLAIEAGQERNELPGFFAAAAPRRAARLRAQDRVIFFFTQSGTTLLAPNLQQEMLARLAETYFTSSGSVTSGMRATAERLNDFLLNRNLRGARQGGQVVGALAMCVLHSSSLYVLIAGPVQVLLLSGGGVERFADPSARGLGQARLVGSRFFTSSVEPGGTLIFTPQAPAAWRDDALRGWAGLPLPELHRCLAGEALDVQAGIVRCEAGRGEVAWASPKPQPGAAARPAGDAPAPEKRAGVFLSGRPLRKADPPAAQTAPAEERPPQKLEAAAVPLPHPVSAQTPPAPQVRRPAAAPVQARPRPQGPSAATVAAAKAASGVFGGLRKGWNTFSGALSRLAARTLPGRPAEGGLNLSPSTMLFIALAVPLAVVAVAATVYFQRGRGEQYQAFLRTARQFADQAAAQQDISLQREDWNQALYWLDKAGSYGRSAEGDQVRQQVQAALDGLDGIQRLNYQPIATGGLPEGANIIRMVATINDVYLLDSTSGSVFRLYRTGQGYEYDPAFKCGPGTAGSATVGKLIDIAPLSPNNEYQSTVMGIDAAGHLAYCAPSLSGPTYVTLVPPDSLWGAIKQMVIYSDVLYVLDPQTNAVYRYPGENGPAFNGGPRFYFGNLVPTLTDVVDFAVDQEFLYLLHADGSMTTCTDAGAATECTDPAPYGDSRPGRDPAPLRFEDAGFIRMQTTQPPDPSLYILDKEAASIYHFSLRKLNLQRQYRAVVGADYPLPARPATAFVVTPNRRALLAFNDQVFFAPLP